MVLKNVSPLITLFLNKLANNIYQTGIYPNKFEVAKVSPIYKKGQKNVCSNYKPKTYYISLVYGFTNPYTKVY